MGPQAAGARSPPEIHSQVLSRVARDPLAALCGIFPRDPLPSLGRQISRLPNQDSPSPQTRSPGRSIRFPRLPRPTLPTFLPGPQPSRNLAAIVGRRFPSPLTGRGRGTNGQPSPPAAAAQPTQEPPPPPARAAPPPARSPRHLPLPPAAPRSLPCWGRGLGWGSALSPWKLRPEAPARRAPGRSAEGPTCSGLQALGPGEGLVGQRSRVHLRYFSRDTPTAPGPRSRGAPLGKLFMVSVRVPRATPRPWPGSSSKDTFPPPGLRPGNLSIPGP